VENVTKPKLVFFQCNHDVALSKFVLLHRQQHVKCLSLFFDVTLINQDCDYREVCDKFKPDLTLFESGVAYSSCYRIAIKNTKAYPEIPKLGLHNGDSWCDARAGFLSDMEHWGIENFFAIATTTAEHIPEIADRLFTWPNFIDTEVYRDYGLPKVIPVLFNGFIHPLYPWRQKIYEKVSQTYPSLTCPNPGYSSGIESRMIYGEKYARTINASWFMPTCGTIERDIVRKHFEIPASKSCMIAEKTPIIEAAGFADMKNCIFADESNVLDKLDYLFQNLDELEKIINAGYLLVHSHHTSKQRDQIFQWFNLYKDLKFNQKIVQSGPFESLTVAEESSKIKNSHIISNGLTRDLLKQGDEKSWLGKHQEAEALYFKCLEYIPWLPEAKFRLALCNLYQGDAGKAILWILQPIQYTLKEYKAKDPDPVEWAYFIISLLCRGKLSLAIRCEEKFPSLYHPELDRVRWVVKVIKNKCDEDNLEKVTISSHHHYTIHQLPERSFENWIDQICIMLKACKQFQFSKTLKNSILLKQNKLSQKNILANEIEPHDSCNRFARANFSNSVEAALDLIEDILESEQNNFDRRISTKLKVIAKTKAIKISRTFSKKYSKLFYKLKILVNEADV
jgi:tetratricopeptide (TPR) repeat protein